MDRVKFDEQVYIAQNDATFFSQSARKAIPEIAAAPAIEGIKEVKEVKKDDKVITAAVKGKKGREAVKYQAPADAEVYPRIAAKSESKLMQIISRMELEGVKVKQGEEVEHKADKGFCISFVVSDLPKFRLAFKQSKGSGKNNKKAMSLFLADKKVADQKDAEKKKAAEKAKAGNKKEEPKKEEKKEDAWTE